MARPTYLPSRVHEGSPFFTSSPIFLLFFDDGHSDRCEVILHGVFGLHFPDDHWCQSIFSCVCWSSVCLLCKHVYAGPLPIFLTGFKPCWFSKPDICTLIFPVLEPQGWGAPCVNRISSSSGIPLQLWIFSCWWVTLLGVGFQTRPPSSSPPPFCCSSFFTSLLPVCRSFSNIVVM